MSKVSEKTLTRRLAVKEHKASVDEERLRRLRDDINILKEQLLVKRLPSFIGKCFKNEMSVGNTKWFKLQAVKDTSFVVEILHKCNSNLYSVYIDQIIDTEAFIDSESMYEEIDPTEYETNKRNFLNQIDTKLRS